MTPKQAAEALVKARDLTRRAEHNRRSADNSPGTATAMADYHDLSGVKPGDYLVAISHSTFSNRGYYWYPYLVERVTPKQLVLKGPGRSPAKAWRETGQIVGAPERGRLKRAIPDSAKVAGSIAAHPMAAEAIAALPIVTHKNLYGRK